jgi:hypothetical protein
MKRSIVRAIFAIAIVGMIVGLAGCPMEEEGTSISDRIKQLEDDLNGNYNNVYKNWHPDSTTRSAGANPTALQTAFPSSETYDITNINVTDDSGSTGSATAVFDSDFRYENDSATFSMEKDGEDWMIRELTIGATNLPNVVESVID